jgi:long-chain acyl-CoA synthetase
MNSIYEQRPWLKNYPKGVPHDLAIESKTALDDFKTTAVQRPDAPAVFYFDRILSFTHIDRFSNSLAAAILDQGLQKGDRIIINLQNVPEFLIVVYAAWKLGIIAVPLNPMYKEVELKYFCKDSGAKIFITHDEIAAGLDLSFFKETSVSAVITCSPLDFFPKDLNPPEMLQGKIKNVLPGTLDLHTLLQKYCDNKVTDPALVPDDVAYLTYTSGTTGPPKGAMNTHGNIAFNARVYKSMQYIDENDVVLGVAPLFHVTGEVAHLAIAALAGIPIVLFYRFDSGEALRLVERWKVTMTVASITVYIALMSNPHIKKRDLSSFVKAYSGGAPVSESIVDQFQKLTGLYLYNVYGMTETNSPSHIVPWGRRAPVNQDSGALSVGLPVPNCIMKIMDLEDGSRALAPGEVGEIVDSGPIVIPGYWQKPQETAKAIRDGWLFTGDIGKMDEDGWFYVIDRKKDMIVASGYKVWPREVEDVIYQHPAVKEAAVVGVLDDYRGETVKAFIALKPGREDSVTPEEIISFCKARMAAYKYPRQVEIVPEIPKTLTGKFLRRKLREKTNR